MGESGFSEVCVSGFTTVLVSVGFLLCGWVCKYLGEWVCICVDQNGFSAVWVSLGLQLYG